MHLTSLPPKNRECGVRKRSPHSRRITRRCGGVTSWYRGSARAAPSSVAALRSCTHPCSSAPPAAARTSLTTLRFRTTNRRLRYGRHPARGQPTCAQTRSAFGCEATAAATRSKGKGASCSMRTNKMPLTCAHAYRRVVLGMSIRAILCMHPLRCNRIHTHGTFRSNFPKRDVLSKKRMKFFAGMASASLRA
jgi:hypothetical protein